MRVFHSEYFQRNLAVFLRRNPKYVDKVRKTMRFLDFDLRHPSLRLHKLSNLGYYSVSVDMKIRIILRIDGDKIWLLDIGTHDQVY